MFKRLVVILVALVFMVTSAVGVAGVRANADGSDEIPGPGSGASQLEGPGQEGQEALEDQGHLTLEEAVRMATEHSPDLRLAAAAVEQAKLGLDQAEYTADRLPDEVVSDYETAKLKDLTPRQAEGGLMVAQSAYEQARLALRLQVETAYYDVLKAQHMVAVSEEALDQAREQLNLARARYEAGTVARIDILGAEVQVADVEANLLSAKRMLQMAEMEFNRITGRELDAPVQLTGDLEYEPFEGIDVQEAVEIALQNRSDIAAAEDKVGVKELQHEIVQRYYTPNVFAYRQAVLELENARAELERTREGVQLEVRQAYLNIQNAEDRFRVREKAIEQAEENLRLARLRYREGVSTSLEVINAQVLLTQARTEALNALYDFNLAKAQFRTAIGKWDLGLVRNRPLAVTWKHRLGNQEECSMSLPKRYHGG